MAAPPKDNYENRLLKIIYFDEGSATDYIELFNDGDFKNVIELIEESGKAGEAGASGKMGAKTRFLKALVGLDASGEAHGDIKTSFASGTVAKSIITNTILTDFLHAVENDDQEAIEIFDGFSIKQIPGSISSIALFTPYLSMFRGGQGVAAGDFDISLDKMDSTLSKAKGYYEFFGIPKNTEEKTVVFRFNSAAFKNNYRPTDLLKMNLIIYAVEVGICNSEDLDADNELKVEGFQVKDNPSYERADKVDSIDEDPREYTVYDALLAGVASNGR